MVGFLTDQMIRRGAHKSVAALENDIRDWIADWNEHPKPFCGPRPPRRSSIPSPDIYSEFQAQDTSRALSGWCGGLSSVTEPAR